MNITESESISKVRDGSQEFNNYRMLDIIKYIAAIMVICVHCDQLFPQEFLNFVIKNIICRIAVPVFFITSAFFVRKGTIKNPKYLTNYLKGTIKSYLFWSLVFIPIGLDWIHQNLTLSGNMLPFALIYGLIYIGTYYHLWYISALIFSIFSVNKLLKYISYKSLFIISILLFLFGSIETYYGLLPVGIFKQLFDTLISVIFTTRSGLLYGMIFVLMGFYIYDHQEKLKSIIKYAPYLTLLTSIVLFYEGIFLYNISRLDMNFLLGLIPFSFFFFLWMLSFPYKPKNDTTKIRELFKYYYFVHPVCIVIIEQLGVAFKISFLSSGVFSFILIVIITHLLSKCIINIKKHLTCLRVAFSILIGLIPTFIISSIIFLLKDPDIILKFEFVTCLWFACSFIMCYLLSKKNNTVINM